MIGHTHTLNLDVRRPLGSPIFGVKLDLRADTGFVPDDGFGTLIWGDRSTGNHNASQATAASQPTQSATGFGAFSKAYVLFDATNDFVDCADHADFEPGAGSFLCMAALRFVSGSGGFQCIAAKGADATNSFRLFRDSANKLKIYAAGGTSYASSSFSIADSADRILVWGVDSYSNQSIYASDSNAVERAAITITGATDNANAFRIGRDHTPAYQANIRLGQLNWTTRAVGVGFSDTEITEWIRRWKLWFGI